MDKQFTPEVRRKLAEQAGISPAYLYQCLTGRREMGTDEAIRVEAATNRKLRRWHVCTKTWQTRWPELATKHRAKSAEVA